MGFIQLNGADVSLQRVHRLILLLIEDADGTPSVGGRLGFVDGMTIGDERIVDLAEGGVATAQKVPEGENSNIAINMDKPYPSFPSVSFFLFSFFFPILPSLIPMGYLPYLSILIK